MINIQNEGDCSGCHACMTACPKHAISMYEDKEGFLYPYVNLEKCIQCSICDNMCQSINSIKVKREPKAYACWNRDENVRMQSSSGGVFTLLAEWIVENKGVVFGAAFDEDYTVHHIAIDSKDDIHRLRGSKYVQSVIGNTYKDAKQLLDDGRYVLFTGTPCQIDGLLHYLGKEYEYLYTQDIICHGVPSPKVWKEYLKYQCKRNKSLLKKDSYPVFRNKKDGWYTYSVSLDFENEVKYIRYHKQDFYMQAFLNNLSLRPSCYECHSKSKNRNSDITLADFWGIDSICPEMFDNKGTSFIFINSKKGIELFNLIKNSMTYKEVDFEKSIVNNSSAYKSSIKPDKRSDFFKYLSILKFDWLVKKETLPPLYKRVLWRIKGRISDFIH